MRPPPSPLPDLPPGLVQPDQRSCGAASLVAARMLLDPPYAARLAAAGRSGFATEVLAMHRRVTGAVALDGRLQLPWPRVIGTPPWAVAHQLSATGGPDVDPVPHDVVPVRHSPGLAVPLLRAALAAGRPAALFVGDTWLPRHVVLAVGRPADPSGPQGSATATYDTARGRTVVVPDSAFATHRLPFARWTRAWFVVTPR